MWQTRKLPPPPPAVARLFSYLVITVIIICVECCPAIWYALGREGGEEGEWQGEREMEDGKEVLQLGFGRGMRLFTCVCLFYSRLIAPLSYPLVDNPALPELP